MRQFFSSFHLDAFGFSASMLCAIHCALLPLLLTFSALSGLEFLVDPAIEVVILGISLMLALSSLIPCYLRHHRKWMAIGVALLGFLFIASGRLSSSYVEEIATPVGALLVAGGHFLNWRQCQVPKSRQARDKEK